MNSKQKVEIEQLKQVKTKYKKQTTKQNTNNNKTKTPPTLRTLSGILKLRCEM